MHNLSSSFSNGKFNPFKVINLLNCEHKCCRDCVSKHFTIIIKDRNISEATCPFCLEPKKLAEDDDLAANYFAKLDVLLKPLIEQDVHDLFQRKLRDRTLMKDPNFKWCYKVIFFREISLIPLLLLLCVFLW